MQSAEGERLATCKAAPEAVQHAHVSAANHFATSCIGPHRASSELSPLIVPDTELHPHSASHCLQALHLRRVSLIIGRRCSFKALQLSGIRAAYVYQNACTIKSHCMSELPWLQEQPGLTRANHGRRAHAREVIATACSPPCSQLRLL